jgi:DNA-binding NarL/FixJ family response regulator
MKKILIVDDHEVLREGVKRIFDNERSKPIFGEASTPQQARDLVRDQDWDVVVLDLSLGDRSGLEVLKELKHIRPKLPVIILSMHSEEQYARRAFQAGASGYVTKGSPRAELVKAINKAIAGGVYVSQDLAEQLVIDLGRDPDRLPHEVLSDREFEVMRLIASGKTVGQIAEILLLSDKTVSTYRARILEKLGIRTNADIIRYGIHNKLVD